MSGAMTATGTVIAGGIGAIGGLIGAGKNSRAAGRALDSQERMHQADLAFRQQQYNRYLGLYGPTEEKLAGEARSSQPLDYEQNYAAIKQNYGDALRGINSSMGMRGIAGSGLDVGAMRGAALGQASGLSQAYAQGLTTRRNLGLTLTGRNQIGQSARDLMGGYQNMAGLYGGQANMYNQAAAQGWQGFGQGLGNLGYSLQNQNKPNWSPLAYYFNQRQQPVVVAPNPTPYGGSTAGGSFNGQAIL